MSSKGLLPAQYWLCCVSDQLWLPTFWLKLCQASPLPGFITSPSGQMGWDDILHSRWSWDSALCLGAGQLGSTAGKTPHLRIWIRQVYTQPSSLVRVYPWFYSADEQSHWLGLLLGCWRYELCLPRSKCWLLWAPPPSPSQSDSQGLSPTEYPAITLMQDHRSGSHKATPVLEEWLFPLAPLFPLEELEAQGRLLFMMLHHPGGGTVLSTYSCFSSPSKAICLGLWGAGGCFSLTPMFYDSLCGASFLNTC